jgi:hypothetical protein
MSDDLPQKLRLRSAARQDETLAPAAVPIRSKTLWIIRTTPVCSNLPTVRTEEWIRCLRHIALVNKHKSEKVEKLWLIC